MDTLQLNGEALNVLKFLFPGYIAFRVYLIDKPWNSLNTLHIIFGGLSFSVLIHLAIDGITGALSLIFTREIVLHEAFYLSISIVVALIFGLAWRTMGHSLFHKFLSIGRITNEDNRYTPWMNIFYNPKIHVRQITAYLKDGTALQCDETNFFDTEELRRLGIYSHYVSIDGDISFIANKIRHSKSDEWEDLPDMHITGWGIKTQWIAASEIARLEVRLIDKNKVC